MNYQHGISLVELMITVSIIFILVILGGPTIVAAQKSLQLKAAVESSYFAFQGARAAAISLGKEISVSIVDSTNWCVGISDHGACDCTILNNCAINSVEQLVKARDFEKISILDVHFGTNNLAVFDGIRGLSIGNAGSLVFSDGVNQAKLILSNMGRVRICVAAGHVGRYSPC
ncbi:MAG: Tfp pilus assembly protein FimT [Paraglaciecola sp.]|jgi:Tfp pilus assembly protein FimT